MRDITGVDVPALVEQNKMELRGALKQRINVTHSFPDVQVPCPITSRESIGKLAARSSGSYECPCPGVCSVCCPSEGPEDEGLVSKMLFPLISSVQLRG